MTPQKLSMTIAQLEQYGSDLDALVVARAVADRRKAEQRSAAALKGWATRRARQPGHQRTSGDGATTAAQVDEVEVEEQYSLWSQRRSQAELGPVTRLEHALVLHFKKHLEAAGDEVKSMRIRISTRVAIRTDLFNVSRQQLVEAKDEPSREKIRMALGQLLDYRRFISPPPASAVLVPKKPADDLIDLLSRYDIAVIWRAGTRFHDTRSGAFI
jgi:hypothetical protein